MHVYGTRRVREFQAAQVVCRWRPTYRATRQYAAQAPSALHHWQSRHGVLGKRVAMDSPVSAPRAAWTIPAVPLRGGAYLVPVGTPIDRGPGEP